MGAGHAQECQEHGRRIRALCRQLLADEESRRLSAYDGLITLAPSERDLMEFLRLKRQADMSDQFVYSLRLDTAVHAARELAANISRDQGSIWTGGNVFTLLNRLIFGGGQDDGGIAGRLYDSDRYRRSKRSRTAGDLITLLDEALQRRDDSLRGEAFRQLWNWAAELCHMRCNDAEAAQDLASEAIVQLLKTARPSVGASRDQAIRTSLPPPANFLLLSGVETLSRIHVALFGYRKGRGGWPGLFDKHFADRAALKEVSWDQSSGDLLHAPLSEVADRAPVEMPPQEVRGALAIFREELNSKESDGLVGPKSAQALSVILNHVQTNILDGQKDNDGAMTVASIRLRASVEAQTMRPYLAKTLGITRPHSLLRRVLAIKDILVAAQLYDRDLTPLAINEQDLPTILIRLRIQAADSQFRKTPRQRRTLEALIDFWEELVSTRAAGEADCTTIYLPPLVSWSRRVRVQTDVLQLLKDQLGMGGTAAHNCVKRQLQLLESWGFVKEDSDG
ncbi:MAG: hypothetical protein H8E66_33915 [Planctomycetes bacterium]|nr:hypothetical protein [Planctomycetota bacterium]